MTYHHFGTEKGFVGLEYFDVDLIAWIDTMLVWSVSTYQMSWVDQEFTEQASLSAAYCFFFFFDSSLPVQASFYYCNCKSYPFKWIFPICISFLCDFSPTRISPMISILFDLVYSFKLYCHGGQIFEKWFTCLCPCNFSYSLYMNRMH